jgi:phosphoglycerate dehydrogenase-like enzyme
MFILMLAHRWHQGQADLERKFLYGTMGEELEGRLLLLFGFGASARALASRALGCGMRIAAVEIQDVSDADRREFRVESVGKPQDLERILPSCDYLSLHLHLNPATHHIINGERLKLMNPSAFLINVARGALVDEQALYESLKEGRLAGAGLDVFGTEPPDLGNPLFKLPNVVVTPHIAGATDGTSRRRAACVAENVQRIAEGLEPKYRVDLG